MGLKRVGVLLFTVGLLLSLLSAVVFGLAAGGTEVFCEDHEPDYSLEDIDPTSLTITYSDGCNIFTLNPLVSAGGLLAILGLLVGLGGVVQQRNTE